METERIPVDPVCPDPGVIAHAVAILRRGGLVVFPTETVYGLGALADDATAAARIFAAKGRPGHNPLIAHVTDRAMATGLATTWPGAADALASAFWPGPVTLVVPRNPTRIPDVVSAGTPTVAVRAPGHAVPMALLAALGRPLAAPSANRYQSLTPTTADHVVKGLDGRVDLVLDGGPCRYGIESTVVDCTRDPPVVLRHGAVPWGALARVVPGLTMGAGTVEDGTAAVSPGMARRHYAPQARLVVVPWDTVAHTVDRATAPVGLVCTHTVGRAWWSLGDTDRYAAGPAPEGAPGVAVTGPRGVHVAMLPDDPVGYASGMFAALHALDDQGCATIVAVAVPDESAWAAVHDRLERART